MTVWVVAIAALQAGQPSMPPGQEPASPVDEPAPVSSDPAVVHFSGDAGLLLAAIKPDKTEDYEAAIAALQAALATTENPELRRMADGWMVFKAVETDAAGNALYVHIVRPPVAGADYRPSWLLDTLLADAPAALLDKYRDAFAGPPSKLSLAEVANLSEAPPPDAVPEAEDTATPTSPTPPSEPPPGPSPQDSADAPRPSEPLPSSRDQER